MPPGAASPSRPVRCYSRRVSSLATAPPRATPEPAGAAPWSRARRVGLITDVVLGVALATGFGVIVFAATGGTDLAPNTWVEIALTAIGAACARRGDPARRRGRAWGGVAVLLFAALAALTYASIAWSVQPADSWVEANRTLSYLAAFGAAAALARLAPAALAGPRLGGRDRGRRDLRLRAARQGVPGHARRRRSLRAPARAVLVLERDRIDGRARPARMPVGRRAARTAGARSRRSRCRRSRCCSRC